MARKTKEEMSIAIDELGKLVKSGEILYYTESDLSQKLNLTEKTIRKHLNHIKTEVGNQSIKAITMKFMEHMNEIMKDIEYYWLQAKKEKDEKKIMYYSKKVTDAWYSFADLLEKFGIKPKATENINLKQETVSLNINLGTEDFNQIKELEARRG